MIKDDFVIIGIGQGGNRETKCFYDNGYRTFFINTSYDDLSQLGVKNEFIYHIPASQGCAKNRELAINYGKEYYNVMVNKLLEVHPTSSIFVVQYTLGGGTGGGLSNFFIAVLRRILNERGRNKDKIIAVVSKPKSYESYQMQSNAQFSLKELYNLLDKKIVDDYFIINNDSRKDLDELNEEHFLLFDRLIEGEEANDRQNADGSERSDLFFSGGGTALFEFDCNKEEDFKDCLINAYDDSIYCKPSKHYSTLGIALNNQLSEDKCLPLIQEVVGYAPNIHSTITRVSNLITISGAKKNDSIMNEIINIANNQAKLINEQKEEEIESIELSNITTTPTKKERIQEVSDISLEDIFKMF